MGKSIYSLILKLKMKSVILLAVFCSLFYISNASQRFARLQTPEERLGCSLQEALACTDEIQTAMNDCSHVTDINNIITCINDILGASDCIKCVCDVIPFLCP